jgi:hypothetical protein
MRASCFLVLFLVAAASCKKKSNAYDPAFRGQLVLNFDNVVGTEDLRLNTGTYTNAVGEQFTVRSLQYFISNISLVRTDGDIYVVPQDSSYFLIEESSALNTMPTLKVPEGEYSELRFIIGVDSLRSTMDLSKRTGVLAPTITTYFNENDGYIFFNLEGTSPQAPSNNYRFNIGGYGGKTSPTFNNLKNVSLNLTERGISKIREGKQSTVNIKADVAFVFTGFQNISLATNNIVGFEPFSVNIANNYSLMFSHGGTGNE